MKNPKLLAEEIKKEALRLGFDLVGFSPVTPPAKAYAHYKSWLKKKLNAGLSYMSEPTRRRARASTEALLKNAKTVISLGINYYHAQPPLPRGHGRIATYAFGRDYHKIIKKRLKLLEKFIQNLDVQSEISPPGEKSFTNTTSTISYVDTGPILERTFAVEAGLGFIGKNTTLITKEFGSFVFLAEIITDLSLPTTNKKKTSDASCGSCTRCIDACPTKALGNGFLDANKCLSYHTIENKSPTLPIQIQKAVKKTNSLFGCDICQLICPHNCRAKQTTHSEFLKPKIAGDSLPINAVLNIETEAKYLKQFAGSPLMRAKKNNLQRNAKILLTFIRRRNSTNCSVDPASSDFS